MSNLRKPPQKVVDGLVILLEELLKKPKLRVESTSYLTSVVFTQSKVPLSIGEIREEFTSRGYLLFYSEVVEKKQPYTFFNLTKLI
jgi:hypothetical protein